MTLRFTRREMMRFAALAPACAPYALQAAAETRSTVSLVKGDSRRKNVTDALTAIDDRIKPFIRRKNGSLTKNPSRPNLPTRYLHRRC